MATQPPRVRFGKTKVQMLSHLSKSHTFHAKKENNVVNPGPFTMMGESITVTSPGRGEETIGVLHFRKTKGGGGWVQGAKKKGREN